ncbi:MAG: acetate--CoA ligase family protein, partial [Acidimicrobiia bacterium]|nr:acetate--CoA ligase family protein [Acidimicrobiia bacterium]
MPVRDLDRLLRPRTVVVVGGDPAERAIRQSDRLGFEGEIWPVHPSRSTMAGRHVYPSLDDLPGAPDSAFVAVNRRLTVEVVRQLAGMGCGGAVLYASGFAEAGEEGAEIQERLLSGHRMPLIGPNCYGIINAVTGAALWPDVQGCRPVRSGPALISQSGNISLNLTMNRRGIDFSYVISLGNQSSVTTEDCLEHFAVRSEVTAVGIHAESIVDPVAFGRAALACRDTRTPVVVLKTGRSEEAERITSSHTAALAAPAAAYDALYERYGVVVAESIPDFMTTLGLLDTIGPIPGNRLVSLSCSGGEAALVADRSVRYPVTFPAFDPEHRERIAATLPQLVSITNPLDYHTFIWGDEPALERCFAEVVTGPFDAAMLVIDWPSEGNDDTDWWPTLRAFVTAADQSGRVGVIVSGLPESLPGLVRAFATERGLGVARSIDEALGGLAAAASWGQWLSGPPPSLHLPAGTWTGPAVTLDEPTAKAILSSAGIPVPDGVVVNGRSEDGPARLPRQLCFPLVAKAVGPAHKSRAGGVITGIADPEQLGTAIERLGRDGRQVLVEEQVTGAVAELLLSVSRQPPIGLVVTLGAGGTLVEWLADTTGLLAPVTRPELRRALHRLRIGHMLEHQVPGLVADPEPIREIIHRMTALLARRPDLTEVEINPLILTEEALWAVDALISTN